jgi:phytoene synthase
MAFETERAFRYYEESMPLLDLIHKKSRPSMWALIEIYHRLLGRIRDSNYDVLERRIRLSSLEKSGILLRALTGA